jgi:hypothetical protein
MNYIVKSVKSGLYETKVSEGICYGDSHGPSIFSDMSPCAFL